MLLVFVSGITGINLQIVFLYLMICYGHPSRSTDIFSLFKIATVLTWVDPQSLRQGLACRQFILERDPKDQEWKTERNETEEEEKSTSGLFST